MTTKRLPAIDYVRECVIYDPDTGAFTWRERPPHHFPHPNAHRWWNAKFAGRPAGRASSDRCNYWLLCFGAMSFKAHRIAWLLAYGEPVPNTLDHIDGDTLNNRIINLRAATPAENGANRKTRADAVSGAKGVNIRRRGNSVRFAAHISVGGRKQWLGYFATLEEAKAARREAAERLHGRFVRHE